jgi:uncharacterized secreted protein with C-terminal beta-propeller domain
MNRWVSGEDFHMFRRFRLSALPTPRMRSRLTGCIESLEARCLLDAGTIELVNDAFEARQNSDAISLDVLANDIFGPDYAGPKEISAVSYGSQGGSISISDDTRSLLYAPPADYEGEEQFTYFVDGAAFATVTVRVQSPLAEDRISMNPDDAEHSLDLLANDPFWADYTGPKRITFVSETSAGAEVRIASDGRSVVYRAPSIAGGSDSLIYIVDDIYSAQVTIELSETVVRDEFESIQNPGTVRLDVLANDPFWPGYSFGKRITSVSKPNQGVAVISADGQSIEYTPAADFSGWDLLDYVVDDRFVAGVSIIVYRPTNDDYSEVDFNSSQFAIDLIGNDHYYDIRGFRHDVVERITSVGPSASGATITIGANGRHVLYTPPENFSGQDTFIYTADGKYPSQVTVNVTRPVRDDYLADVVFQDTPNAILDVRQNDFIGNGYTGAKAITAVGETKNGGRVQLVGGQIQYSPADGYTGSDSFSYTIDDDLQATVNLYVQPLATPDDKSVCVNDYQGQDIPVAVLQNDHFDRGYPGQGRITSAVVTSESGAVSISPDATYLIASNSAGAAVSFEYTVDGKYTSEGSVYIQGHLQGDSITVDQNSDGRSFHVMANDFPSDYRWNQTCRVQAYRGNRKISSVGLSQKGGIVSVGDDGTSVVYRPPADFLGIDTFTYSVDDVMQASVTVNVFRRVRDDQFRVGPSQQRSLPVLVNDMFGADYRGAARITSVTPTSAAATVSISADGKSVLYTPADGFSGNDVFEYTVDGKQKARVTVSVRDDSNPFPQFESLKQFEDFLVEDATERYQHLFGQTPFSWWWGSEDAGGIPPLPTENRDHSDTNVQVEGIDEGDIVEFDSDYIYALAGAELVILDAWPGESTSVVSRTLIDGTPTAEFLKGDRLTVISTVSKAIPLGDPQRGPLGDIPVGDAIWSFPRIRFQHSTIVTVLDVSDRANVRFVQETTIEGRFVESRAVGDHVYLVVNNLAVAPEPEIIIEIVDQGTANEREVKRYETEQEYVARVRANTGQLFEAALPNYSSFGPDDALARSGLLNEPEEIYLPIVNNAMNLLSIVSINVLNSEPGLSSTSGVYTAGGSIVYASLDNFYVFEGDYIPEEGAVTRVHKFDWDPSTGGIDFTAANYVPGTMINQFSADEFEGKLRVATSVGNAYSGNWSGRSENVLNVLADNGGTLEYVGSLQNLGLNETIRSVRFAGPRAYVVTYRQVDPLFAIDLSNSANPKSVGALTLPGFSSYMQFLTDDRLITVGKNTPDGINGPAQVTLFDVSNLGAPRMIDQHTFERFSTTEAGVDHHAFGYFARHGLVALPSSRQFAQRVDKDGDGFRETTEWKSEYELLVFRVDTAASGRNDSALELLSSIAHETLVRRSGYIGDRLYSIADDSVKVVDVANPSQVLATVDDLRQVEPTPDDPIPPIWAFDFAVGPLFDSAATDLAARLNVAPGQIVRLAAEPGEATGRIDLVLRVDDQQYLYRSSDRQSVELADDSYEFVTRIDWQNPADKFDVNDDSDIAPNDALLIINELKSVGSRALPQSVVRQVGANREHFVDVNADGQLSPIDALLVINRLNELSIVHTNPSQVDSQADPQVIDDLFDQMLDTVGDANLDGLFNSGDLVRVFQSGEYEDDILQNSMWADGDWDGDRDFTTRDLVLAFQRGIYSFAASDPRRAADSQPADALHDQEPA